MSKFTQVLLAMLFLVALFAIGLWYFPVIKKNERLREKELALIEKINKQKTANAELRAYVEAIKTDPKMVESLARERLHFALPDEVVIRFNAPRRPRSDRRNLPDLFARP